MGTTLKKLASKRISNFFSYTNSSVATPSGDSLRQTVHTHCASVHQAAKSVAALSRVASVTAGLAKSNGSLPPGL